MKTYHIGERADLLEQHCFAEPQLELGPTRKLTIISDPYCGNIGDSAILSSIRCFQGHFHHLLMPRLDCPVRWRQGGPIPRGGLKRRKVRNRLDTVKLAITHRITL